MTAIEGHGSAGSAGSAGSSRAQAGSGEPPDAAPAELAPEPETDAPRGDDAAPSATEAAKTRGAVRRAVHGIVVSLRQYLRGLTYGGMAGALIFFCFSMTPSLLPRPWYLQGVASGICTALGYAIGTFVGWLLHKFGFRLLRTTGRRRIAYRVLIVVGCIAIPLFGVLGAIWQHQVRVLVDVDPSDSNFYALVLLISFMLARALLGIARFLRWVVGKVGRFGSRWVPLPVAKLVGTVIIVGIVVTLTNDVLMPPVLNALNSAFSTTDKGTAPGAVQPVIPERSGSPQSLVRWSDLGREGRTFISSGPTQAEIAAFAHGPADVPIRVYAGVASADSLQHEADLVVRELQRTGGFDRSVLVVATTTGRGWINQVAAAAIEYMWHGDTAIASMQYSYLSSPMAFLLDRTTPPEAGEILFDTVHAAWAKLPPAHRPRLLVMGESLGSFGSQGAFDGLQDALTRADGAVWSGTPQFTPLWQAVTADRQPGSPEQIPDIDGCATVCFAASAADIPAGAHPKVVYLQHTNDPVVWWSFNLLLSKPDWLKEPPQPGRSAAVHWIPLVTFWQVTMDMIFSSDMPPGAGHDYRTDFVNAFAAVAPPPGWSAADTQRLREHLAGASTGG